MKTVLYAGSFDPITNGHLDVIARGSSLCDRLIVGVLNNESKSPLFSASTRVELIKASTKDIKNVEVDSFSGLLADYVVKKNVNAVLRGLRAGLDFEYEQQMAQMNARLYGKGVETVFLMTDPKHSFVSSSLVKEVFSLGGSIEGLVPMCVLDYLKENTYAS